MAHGVEIVAFVSSVGEVDMRPIEPFSPTSMDKDKWINGQKEWWNLLSKVTREVVDSNEVRCPSPEWAEKMKNVNIILITLLYLLFLIIQF